VPTLLRALAQRDELSEITVLKSIEVNTSRWIARSARPDTRRLDLVVGAIHSHLDIPQRKQTERILRVMDNRCLNILAHPTVGWSTTTQPDGRYGMRHHVVAGRTPAVQVNVDATAAMQAGIGVSYIQQILASQIARYAARSDEVPAEPVKLVTHMAYNPNLTTSWFNGIMGIVNNVTMLAIILCGAAVVREREHGTMDHLLFMPLMPFQIAMAKIVGNGAVIAVAAWLSLTLCVRLLLRIPVQGLVPFL
jgi:ABC-type multidrug transport system permease subunit